MTAPRDRHDTLSFLRLHNETPAEKADRLICDAEKRLISGTSGLVTVDSLRVGLGDDGFTYRIFGKQSTLFGQPVVQTVREFTDHDEAVAYLERIYRRDASMSRNRIAAAQAARERLANDTEWKARDIWETPRRAK
jgi:hypothetical protein